MTSAQIMLKTVLANVLGLLGSIIFFTFIFLTSPVYILRLVVILLSKWFRPDLSENFDELSAIFAGDYFAETNTRANIVACMIFRGHVSIDRIRSWVQENWINAVDKTTGKPLYEKLHQRPEKWLGFLFWKKISTPFSIDEHVHQHSGKYEQFTDDQLEALTEKLLNTRIPKQQSPWKVHLIENYVNPNLSLDQGQSFERQHMSIAIFQFHHCLIDGTGLKTMVFNALNGNHKVLYSRTSQSRKIFSWRNIPLLLTFPMTAFISTAYFLSFCFRPDPLKIPDSKKSWHLMYAKSGPISIEDIKRIKNKFDVSYGSVLLSAISAAIHKTINNSKDDNSAGLNEAALRGSSLCMNVLPRATNSKRSGVLANDMGATIFPLSTTSFPSSVERLKAVHEMLETSRLSAVPLITQCNYALTGNHSYLAGSLFRNEMISILVSNVAGAPGEVEMDNGTRIIYNEAIIGCLEGDIGMTFLAVSHGENTGIQVSAERALMTKDQLRMLIGYVKEEISILHDVAIQIKMSGQLRQV